MKPALLLITLSLVACADIQENPDESELRFQSQPQAPVVPSADSKHGESLAAPGESAGREKEMQVAEAQNGEMKTISELSAAPTTVEPVEFSEEVWRERLDPMSFRVLREEGTERAFTGKYWDDHREGTFLCRGCGLELFAASTKFESGTGWPSFYAPIESKHVATDVDLSYGARRTEVHCARCSGHLGHVFPDGPPPTGQRYCINSASLLHSSDSKL